MVLERLAPDLFGGRRRGRPLGRRRTLRGTHRATEASMPMSLHELRANLSVNEFTFSA